MLLHLIEYLLITFGPKAQFTLKLIQFIDENELEIIYSNVERIVHQQLIVQLKDRFRASNYQRSIMSQQRINALSVLCIENQMIAEMEYEDIVKAITKQKNGCKI